MGSTQSHIATPPEPQSQSQPHLKSQTEIQSQTDPNVDVPTTTTEESGNKRKNKKTNLTGFALVQHKCRRHKRLYDKCYSQWYRSSFLGVNMSRATENTNSTARDDCDELFEKYRECIYMKMQKQREKQGLGVDTLTKGSALMEFLEEKGFDEEDEQDQ